MKKKKIMLYLALTAFCLGGCQKTPDEQIVREKGVGSISQYEQDTEQTETSVSETAAESETAENPLRTKLGVPQRYESTVRSEDGSLEVVCSAEIEVPNVSQVDVYQVTQRAFDQELMDTFIQTFAGTTEVYDVDSYANSGTKTPIVPQVPGTGLENNRFTGICEKDNDKFFLFFKVEAGRPMIMEIYRIDENDPEKYSRNPYGWNAVESIDAESLTEANMTEEGIKEKTGITAEEAQRVADEKVAQMGLTDMKARAQILSVHQSMREDGEMEYSNVGWKIVYTREAGGFPVTYDEEEGGGLVSMDDDVTVPWSYESVEIVVNQEGIQQAVCHNLYDLGEKQVENVKLKSFSEIMSIFEEMIQIQNANMQEGGMVSKKMEIKRITLGYSRITDPGNGDGIGLLVPVWDFYGSEQDEATYEGENYQYEIPQGYYSKMTINAIDGTIIQRSLGY